MVSIHTAFGSVHSGLQRFLLFGGQKGSAQADTKRDVLAVGSAFSSSYSYCTVCKYSKIHRPIKNKEADKFRLSALLPSASLSPSVLLPSASLSLSCLSSIVAAGRIGDFSLKPNRHFHVRAESYAALLSVAIKR